MDSRFVKKMDRENRKKLEFSKHVSNGQKPLTLTHSGPFGTYSFELVGMANCELATDHTAYQTLIGAWQRTNARKLIFETLLEFIGTA